MTKAKTVTQTITASSPDDEASAVRLQNLLEQEAALKIRIKMVQSEEAGEKSNLLDLAEVQWGLDPSEAAIISTIKGIPLLKLTKARVIEALPDEDAIGDFLRTFLTEAESIDSDKADYVVDLLLDTGFLSYVSIKKTAVDKDNGEVKKAFHKFTEVKVQARSWSAA